MLPVYCASFWPQLRNPIAALDVLYSRTSSLNIFLLLHKSPMTLLWLRTLLLWAAITAALALDCLTPPKNSACVNYKLPVRTVHACSGTAGPLCVPQQRAVDHVFFIGSEMWVACGRQVA